MAEKTELTGTALGTNGYVPLTGVKWIAKVYLTNYTNHEWVKDTEAEAKEVIYKLMSDPKYQKQIASTQVLKRDFDNPKYKGGLRL